MFWRATGTGAYAPVPGKAMKNGLFLHQILPHIQSAGAEDNAALDEVLEVLVDAGHSQADED